jgi:hypothetical protein
MPTKSRTKRSPTNQTRRVMPNRAVKTAAKDAAAAQVAERAALMTRRRMQKAERAVKKAEKEALKTIKKAEVAGLDNVTAMLSAIKSVGKDISGLPKMTTPKSASPSGLGMKMLEERRRARHATKTRKTYRDQRHFKRGGRSCGKTRKHN